MYYLFYISYTVFIQLPPIDGTAVNEISLNRILKKYTGWNSFLYLKQV